MNRKSLLKIIGLMLGDLIIINCCFVLSYWLRFYQEFGAGLGGAHPIAPFAEYAKALLFISYVWLFTFQVMGLYDLSRNRDFIDVIYRVIKAASFATIVVLSLTFFYRHPGGFNYSRLVILFSWLLSIIMQLSFRVAIRAVRRRRHLKGYDARAAIVVGANEMAKFVCGKITENPALGYNLIGYVEAGNDAVELGPGISRLGDLKELQQLLKRRQIDEVILARPDLGHFELLELVSLCEMEKIRLIMVPSVYDLLIDYADVYELEGIPMVALQEKPMNVISLAAKRVFDLLVAGLLLIVTAPLWVVILILIRRDSPGAAIFRQRRAGRDGKPFHMLKFRTMVIEAEELRDELMAYASNDEPVFKMPNDPRVTRIGRFLRRSSLDELPQLLNVLKGEMSFIGPRPEEMCFAEQYDIWQRRRLKVKPGITGLQQIKCRGTLSLTERVKYDIYYIRKRSLLMDLGILLQTIPVVISGRGAN